MATFGTFFAIFGQLFIPTSGHTGLLQKYFCFRKFALHFSSNFATTKDCLLLWCTSSVTRFGKISPLGQNFKSLGQFLKAYLVFGKIVSILGQIFYAFMQIYIVTNGQILINNNFAIWSHCRHVPL